MKILGKKGHGYFCNVKILQDEPSGKKYALKELKKEHFKNGDYRYRFNREVHLLKNLQGSENIIELIENGHDDEKESLWYLMPLADYNLYDFIKKFNSSLKVEERYELVRQIINAVKIAHEKGILHRDISPNNVLVFKEGDKIVLKVSDFGLGKDSESLSHYSGSHVNGYGQYLYVSPEQKEKLKDASFPSDIYSLGKLVYFIFTGRDPEKIKSFELSTLVDRATSELKEDRHQSINEFEAHFNALKEFNLNSKISIDDLTLREIIDYKPPFSWIEIHEILREGKYVDHVYRDYIYPVLKLLGSPKKFTAYYLEVKLSIIDFVQTFSDRLNECYKTVGWPFTSLNDFGSFLINIIKIVDDDEVRLICFKQLWYIAFEVDQWAVQSEIKKVFNENFISTNICTQLSEYIIGSEIDVNLKVFSDLKLPLKIRKAIHLSKENSKKDGSKDVEW